MKEKVRQSLYYAVIGVVSFIAVAFLPMLGSNVEAGWNLPKDGVGWLVWAVTKTLTAIINITIFYCFNQQALLNVKDDERYITAWNKMYRLDKEKAPRSPKHWTIQQYAGKGTGIFIGTLASTIALVQAVLSYDWVVALTFVMTIIMGLVFGVLQMRSAERYWTEEFPAYVDSIECGADNSADCNRGNSRPAVQLAENKKES